jgi:hypothetical protein
MLSCKFLNACAAAVVGAAMISSANAAPILSIDFGPSSSPVEPGFVAQTSGSVTHSTVAGDVSVASDGSFFNRSATQGYTSAALYGDFNFKNSFGTLTLTIDGPGIAASTDYEIKFYSLDSHHGSTGGTVTYTGVSGTVGGTVIAYNTGFANDNASTSVFTSNGAGAIVIEVTGTNEGPRISGFELSETTPIPEPASVAMGALGVTLLISRRRR